MSPRKKAQLAFTSAVILLVLSGFAAYITIYRLLVSEKWVIHTLDVRAAIGDLDSSFARAARARSGYVISGAEDYRSLFESTVPDISRRSQQLQDLVRDNRTQDELCKHLEEVTAHRLVQLRESIELKMHSPENQQGQTELDRQGIGLASEMTSIMQQMRSEEDQLLAMRQKAARSLLVLTVVTLVIAFILALELLAVHFRLLSAELKAREDAEQSARNSEESLRRLTGRLLQVQDAERRKFSRELHDSLGQYLVGVKMNLEMFVSQPKDELLAEAIQLLDQSIIETRTISHLLHPPLLDEAGLSSAVKWYVEGFAQRSGIEVELDLPDNASRLPRPVALGLFRILQESLTNIHRHSGSAKAEVTLRLSPIQAFLEVRDYGRGIAAELLDSLQRDGENAGVGLAGMRERVRELGGYLRIEARTPGTVLLVTIPLARAVNETAATAAD